MARRSTAKAIAILLGFVGLMAMVASAPASAANGSVSYAYDALGRVVSASYDTGVIIIYQYDANGNRTSQVVNVNNSVGVWNSFHWGAALWQ
jgi:YD repeat-containing protein